MADNRFPFTADRLARLESPGGRQWYYDERTPGLALSVSATGKRVWYWYKKVNGRPVRLRLGTSIELNIETARTRAKKHNATDWTGRDPAGEKRAARDKALRQAGVGELWASYRDHHLADCKARTITESTRLYDAFLSPWARRPIASVTTEDVERLKTAIGATGHVTANRVVSLLGTMYRSRGHAFGLPRGFSPTTGIDFFPEHVRDRVLSTAELAKVMQAIDADDNPTVRDYFRMLIYTGQRKNTVGRMTWQDLNIDGGTWKIPGEKTKNGKPLVLTLIPEALAIVKKRYADNPPDALFVFTGKHITPETVATIRKMREEGQKTRAIADAVGLSQTGVMHVLSPAFVQRGVTPFGGANKAWSRIIKRAGIEHVTIHDIRRSFCTSLIERGLPLPIVAAAMGHRSMATTQRHYSFASDKAVADATLKSMAGLLADVAKLQAKPQAKNKVA